MLHSLYVLQIYRGGPLHILTKCLPPYGNAIWLMYLIIYYPGVLLPLKFLAECGRVYRRTEILSYILYFADIFCICILYTKYIMGVMKNVYRASNALIYELTRTLEPIRSHDLFINIRCQLLVIREMNNNFIINDY